MKGLVEDISVRRSRLGTSVVFRVPLADTGSVAATGADPAAAAPPPEE